MSSNEFFNKKKGNWNNNNYIIIIIITTTFLRTIFSTRFPCPLYLPLGLRGWGGGEGGLFERGFKQESGEVSSPVTSGFLVRYLFTS